MKKNNILRLRIDSELLEKIKNAKEKMRLSGIEISQSQLIRKSIADTCNKILASKRIRLLFED